MSKDPIILPEKYYLAYFNYLLDFVERKYEHVLDEPEHSFYESFRNLSEDAKCLYLRFSNRKGQFFRLNKITYQEITNVAKAKEELAEQQFIRINENSDPMQFRLFTKPELISYFDFLERKSKKEEILEELTAEDVALLHEKEEIAETLKVTEVEFIKLLFFGNRHSQMTDFVVRDVGNVKLEKLDEQKFKPWCKTRDEALAVMQIAELKQLVRSMKKSGLMLDSIIDEIPWNSLLKYPAAAKNGGKLLVEMGKYLEQTDQLHLAIDHYRLTDVYPARERTIRILEKLDHSEEAMSIANQVINNPVNASEFIFASDFLRKSGARINRSMTERLKDAPEIRIPEAPRGKVENAVLQHLAEQGWNGFHAENFVWRSLFGLVFWDIIFSQETGAFHHPLQRQPSDLEDSNFFLSRNRDLKKRLNDLTSKRKLLHHVFKVFAEKEGTANRLVIWHESMIPALEVIIKCLKLTSIKKVLLEIPKNIRENSAGFPDLFLWKGRDYIFYEVKSPNDQLSAQQLFWLNYMDSVGINADVLKVQYIKE